MHKSKTIATNKIWTVVQIEMRVSTAALLVTLSPSNSIRLVPKPFRFRQCPAKSK